MAVRAQCPRCKQPLSVPNKLAGSYASCPRCQGRFWVSKDAPLDPSVSDSMGFPSPSTLTLTQAPAGGPPLATPPGKAAVPSIAVSSSPMPVSAAAGSSTLPPVPPRQYFPSVTPLAPVAGTPIPLPPVDGVPSAPPAAPPQARKVARLVSAETAQSSLKLAADGQLPHLQLQEDDKKDKGKGKSRSIPPLVLVGAWVLSVVLTLGIVLISSDQSNSDAATQAKMEALQKIEDPQFFGNPARAQLLPYQRLLREARQARARHDSKAEQQYYKQVLDLLHMETWDGSPTAAARNRLEKGVTGSRDRDRELEQLILTVLGD